MRKLRPRRILVLSQKLLKMVTTEKSMASHSPLLELFSTFLNTLKSRSKAFIEANLDLYPYVTPCGIHA